MVFPLTYEVDNFLSFQFWTIPKYVFKWLFLRRIFKSLKFKVFPEQFGLFTTLNSKMSRNMRKMCHKVRNGQNLPHESPNFTNYFFKSNFTYNLSHFSTSLRPQYQNSFFLFFFSALNSKMSKNMCIWRHKLCNSKTGFGPTFTWSNEPWFNSC